MCKMDGNKVLITVVVLLYTSFAVEAQSNPVSRCFQFTWLGPRYNNESVFMNATCLEATRMADGIPCAQPLVASFSPIYVNKIRTDKCPGTDDGTWPDVDYIWTHHAQDATCILGQNDVCAQYSYYFNGIVDNSTYMCTRAMDSNGQAVTSGCYQQRNGSFVTQVCFCRSVPGGVPCNEAAVTVVPLTIFILVVASLLNGNVPYLWSRLFE